MRYRKYDQRHNSYYTRDIVHLLFEGFNDETHDLQRSTEEKKKI